MPIQVDPKLDYKLRQKCERGCKILKNAPWAHTLSQGEAIEKPRDVRKVLPAENFNGPLQVLRYALKENQKAGEVAT